MRTIHGDYSEQNGDFSRLVRFFIATGGTPRALSGWCLIRIVDWKLALYENKRAYASFCEDNAHLWFDAFGELAGFAISEGGDAGFHVLTLEEERSPFSTEVTEHQCWESGILERYVFRSTHTFYTRRFDLTRDLVPRSPLEAGFAIVDMRGTKSHTLFC